MSSSAGEGIENEEEKRLQCEMRLSNYMHLMRNRPVENDMRYWEEFVFKVYDLDFKVSEFWCFSSCKSLDGINNHDLTMAKKCNFCGLTTQYQIAGTNLSLPKLFKLKFNYGVLDEILYLNTFKTLEDLPSGGVLVKYDKAVRELVYEKYRVTHEGKFRVKFTNNWKILSLEFCVESFTYSSSYQPTVSVLNFNGNRDVSSISRDLDENSQTRLQEDAHQDRESFESVYEFGLHQQYWTWCDLVACFYSLAVALDFAIEHNLSPKEFLQEVTIQVEGLKRRRFR